MAELTIEQKAKAYDKALERAKSVDDPEWLSPRDVAEYIFPELKESDNKRVRIKLIEFFKGYYPDKEWWGNITQGNILAWLEEHDEQKPWSEEDESMYIRTLGVLGKCYIGELPTEVEEELKWFKSLKDRVQSQPKQEWGEEDEEKFNEIIDFLDYKGHKTDVEFLKSLRDRVQPQQEWSEEDEEMLNLIIARLHSHPNVDLEEYSKEYEWLKNKLKSLRPQSTWKPSDEQMKALSAMTKYCDIATSFDAHEQRVVESLYQDLNKLREK